MSVAWLYRAERSSGYAAARISSRLKGKTNKFGWLQTPATIFQLRYNGLGDSTPEPFSFGVQLGSKTPQITLPSCAAIRRFLSSLTT